MADDIEQDEVNEEKVVEKSDCLFCRNDEKWKAFADRKDIGLYNLISGQIQEFGMDENVKNPSSGINTIYTNTDTGFIIKEINRSRNICNIKVTNSAKVTQKDIQNSYCQDCRQEIKYNRFSSNIFVVFNTHELLSLNGERGAIYRADYTLMYQWFEENLEACIIYTPLCEEGNT